jgi:hypothetical protein
MARVDSSKMPAQQGRAARAPGTARRNTVQLGWDGGVFGLLRRLWPAGVVGAFDVPLGHLGLDDPRCCTWAPDRVKACDQAA